ERSLTAGVSSFGMGGTNCHAVLTEAPAKPDAGAAEKTRPSGEEAQRYGEASGAVRVVPWLVSGTSPAALCAQAGALREHLRAHPGLDPVDVGHALATTRTAFAHRAVVLGADGGELLDRLAALADGTDTVGLAQGHAVGGRVAFLFSGQGSQRLNMGRELSAAYPVFATALREVCAGLDPHLETPLLDVVFADPGSDTG
ncbi:ketoacyl-synthetase C-terminal extension domain-containing protein, partial [Streptomyces sp. MCAF7]